MAASDAIMSTQNKKKTVFEEEIEKNKSGGSSQSSTSGSSSGSSGASAVRRQTTFSGSSSGSSQSKSSSSSSTSKSSASGRSSGASAGSSSGGGSSARSSSSPVTWKATPTSAQSTNRSSGGTSVTGLVLNNMRPQPSSYSQSAYGHMGTPTFAAAQRAAQNSNAPLIQGVSIDVSRAQDPSSRRSSAAGAFASSAFGRMGTPTFAAAQRAAQNAAPINTPPIQGVRFNAPDTKEKSINRSKVTYGTTVDDILKDNMYTEHWKVSASHEAPKRTGEGSKIVSGRVIEGADPDSDMRKWIDKQNENYEAYKRTPSWNGRMRSIAQVSAGPEKPTVGEKAAANLSGFIGTLNNIWAKPVKFVTDWTEDVSRYLNSQPSQQKAHDDIKKAIDENVSNKAIRKFLHAMTGTMHDKAVDEVNGINVLNRIASSYVSDSNRRLQHKAEVNRRADATSNDPINKLLYRNMGMGLNEAVGSIVDNTARMAADVFIAYAVGAITGGTALLEASAREMARTMSAEIAGGGSAAIATAANIAGNVVRNPMFWSTLAGTLPDMVDDSRESMRERVQNNSGTYTVGKDLVAVSAATLASLVSSAVEVGGTGEGHGADAYIEKLGVDKKSFMRTVWDWAWEAGGSEGMEEIVQGAVERQMNNVLAGRFNYDDAFSLSNPNAVVNPYVMAQEFGMGALTGLAIGGGSAAVSAAGAQIGKARFTYDVGRAINQSGMTEDVIDAGLNTGATERSRRLANKLADRYMNGIMPSDYQAGKQFMRNAEAAAHSAALADAVQMQTGAKVNLRNGLTDNEGRPANGFVSLSGREIFAEQNPNVPEGDTAIPETIKHEATHLAERYAPEQYQKYHNFIINAAIENDPEAVERRRQELIQNNYKPEEADYEIAAELSEHFLKNPRLINALARRKPDFAEKVHDVISAAAANMRDAGRSLRAAKWGVSDAGYKASNGIRLTYAQLHDAEVMWREAMRNTGAETDTDTSADDIRNSIKYTTDNTPAVVVDKDILSGVPKEKWNAAVKNELKKFSDGIPVSGWLIKVNKDSRNEYVSSDQSKYYRANDMPEYVDKMNAAGQLDEIVLASTKYINVGADEGSKYKDFARGKVLLQIGKNKYIADVLVALNNENDMVLRDVVNFEPITFEYKKTALPDGQMSKTSPIIEEPSSNNTIPQTDGVVNTGNDIKFSRRGAQPSPARSVADYFAGYLDESQLPKDELYERMDEAYRLTGAAVRELASGAEKTAQNEAWDYVRAIAADIVRNSYMPSADSEQYNEAKQELRGRRIYVPEDVRRSGEIADAGYGYNRRRVFGQKLYLVNDPSKGAHVEDVYTDLHNLFPQYFPEAVGAETQLNNIIDFMQGQPDGGRVRMYSDKGIDALASSIVDDPYDKVLEANPKLAQTAPTNSDGTRTRLSNLFTNTGQSEHYSDKFREALGRRKEMFRYNPKAIGPQYESAQAMIEQEGADTVLNAFIRDQPQKPWVSESVATAAALIEHYTQNGDHETAAEVFVFARPYTTTAGQASQAWSLIKRLSKEGKIIAVTRENIKRKDDTIEKVEKRNKGNRKERERFQQELDEARRRDREARQSNGRAAEAQPPQEPAAEGEYTDETIPPKSKAKQGRGGFMDRLRARIAAGNNPPAAEASRSDKRSKPRKRSIEDGKKTQRTKPAAVNDSNRAAVKSEIDRLRAILNVAPNERVNTNVRYSRKSIADKISSQVKDRILRLIENGSTEEAMSALQGLRLEDYGYNNLSQPDRDFIAQVTESMEYGYYGGENTISDADRAEIYDRIRRGDYRAAEELMDGYYDSVLSDSDLKFMEEWAAEYEARRSLFDKDFTSDNAKPLGKPIYSPTTDELLDKPDAVVTRITAPSAGDDTGHIADIKTELEKVTEYLKNSGILGTQIANGDDDFSGKHGELTGAITANTIKKARSYNTPYMAQQLQVMYQLDEVFKNGKVIKVAESSGENDGISRIYTILSPVSFEDGSVGVVKLNVKEYRNPDNPNRIHENRVLDILDMDLTKKEPKASKTLPPTRDGSGHSASGSYTMSIAQMLEFVKNADVKYLPEDYFTSEAWRSRRKPANDRSVQTDTGAPSIGKPDRAASTASVYDNEPIPDTGAFKAMFVMGRAVMEAKKIQR